LPREQISRRRFIQRCLHVTEVTQKHIHIHTTRTKHKREGNSHSHTRRCTVWSCFKFTHVRHYRARWGAVSVILDVTRFASGPPSFASNLYVQCQ
jgi:hypothetical protein